MLIGLFVFNLSKSTNAPIAISIPEKNDRSSSIKSTSDSLPDQLNDDGHIFTFPDESPLIRLYLNVVRDTVCGLSLRTREQAVKTSLHPVIIPFNLTRRIAGTDLPVIGITMIGQKRLNNIEWAIRRVITKNIPGDFIECGVWRGGGSIFARAVFKAFDITDRHVWLADSFQGLPKPRTKNDRFIWEKKHYLRASLGEVQENFRSFDLLDEQVHFCKGYFIDSLPQCGVSQIAVLRMDGDMYESTMDQLFNLYGKIPVGGIVVVDDWNIGECKRAIRDFRGWHEMEEELQNIPGDTWGRFWIKRKNIQLQMDKYKALLGTTTTTTANS